MRSRQTVEPGEEEALREEADQLFLWLSETLGDPRADGLEFVEGVERLAELLVHLRRDGGIPTEPGPNTPFIS